MSIKKENNLVLNLFFHGTGHHEASWRHKDSSAERAFDPTYYQELGKIAEAAKFDAVFFADGPALGKGIQYNAVGHLEPILTLSAIAAVTKNIGLIATASTTYYDTYNLARLFNTLDHISKGRAGWNIVTTSFDQAAENFGLQNHPATHERYERADEFLQAITRLWDSWEDDAILINRENGNYVDPNKIHRAEFKGKHIRVEGAFNAARSPQAYPVLVQAGSSNDGRAFAAKWAEAIFTAHQTIENAKAFYADIKNRASKLGRSPESVKILPGISPFIGSTEAEAHALEKEYNELTIPQYGIRQLTNLTGVELDIENLDKAVPLEIFGQAGDVTNNNRSRLQVIAEIVQKEQPTLRQLLHRLAGARGHRVFTGTPEQVAATIKDWYLNDAADGFNVMPPALPQGFQAFTEHVVPILQKEGLFKTEYKGSTLRENYGLQRPQNQFSNTEKTTSQTVRQG